MIKQISEAEQEEILGRVRQRAEKNPFPRYNHIRIGKIERDHVVLYVDAVSESLNAKGTVHGGLLFAMADFCGATTARTDGRSYTTLSAEAHYLKGVSGGRITAESRLVHRGKTTVLVEVDITDEQGALLFRASITMFCTRDSF